MIYTSYFAVIKNLPSTIIPIGICLYPPKWFHGENIKELSPSLELLSGYKSGQYTMQDYWDRFYNEILNQLDPVLIYKRLDSLGNPDVAMICYEESTDFCHRHIVAYWLTQNLGFVVREYGKQQDSVFGG